MSDDEAMSNSVFQFGTIEETIIMKVFDGLPYNPFTFDLGLRIIKTIPPFENDLFFNITTGCKSVFGRKKNDVEHVLKAPTISSRHFMIDQEKKIADLGSTKGTFIWVSRQKPADLEQKKTFLIGPIEIYIQKISYNQRKVWINIKQDTIEINTSRNPFYFGSHPNCQYRINCSQQYVAYVNVLTMKLHNFMENEDCQQEKGVWERLSPPKIQSQPKQLQSQDLIMVYPYIFQVQY